MRKPVCPILYTTFALPVTLWMSALKETETRLQDELSRSAKLQVRVSQFEVEVDASASTIASLIESKKTLADKARDQVRLLYWLAFALVLIFHRNARFNYSTALSTAFGYRSKSVNGEHANWRSKSRVTIVPRDWKRLSRTRKIAPMSLNSNCPSCVK